MNPEFLDQGQKEMVQTQKEREVDVLETDSTLTKIMNDLGPEQFFDRAMDLLKKVSGQDGFDKVLKALQKREQLIGGAKAGSEKVEGALKEKIA